MEAKMPMKALLENSECNLFHRKSPFEKSKRQLDEEKSIPAPNKRNYICQQKNFVAQKINRIHYPI
jgi:hypothetical protein